MTDGPDILQLLIQHELAIKHLYEAFASVFAGRKDFWRSLADEEQKHADQLGGLRSDAGVGAWLLSDGGVNPQSIKSSIAYVNGQTERALGAGLDLTHALSIAVDLEDALIEEQLSRISVSGCSTLGPVLADIVADTEKHRKILRVALDVERRGRS